MDIVGSLQRGTIFLWFWGREGGVGVWGVSSLVGGLRDGSEDWGAIGGWIDRAASIPENGDITQCVLRGHLRKGVA